jgi:hypothetical protein
MPQNHGHGMHSPERSQIESVFSSSLRTGLHLELWTLLTYLLRQEATGYRA